MTSETMRTEKQPIFIFITIIDHDISLNNFTNRGKLFDGNSKRELLVGLLGCGKTNIVISLIEDPNGLRFENLYIHSKSLYQFKHEYLRTLFKQLKNIYSLNQIIKKI